MQHKRIILWKCVIWRYPTTLLSHLHIRMDHYTRFTEKIFQRTSSNPHHLQRSRSLGCNAGWRISMVCTVPCRFQSLSVCAGRTLHGVTTESRGLGKNYCCWCYTASVNKQNIVCIEYLAGTLCHITTLQTPSLCTYMSTLQTDAIIVYIHEHSAEM